MRRLLIGLPLLASLLFTGCDLASGSLDEPIGPDASYVEDDPSADNDGDGWAARWDCDDGNEDINPDASDTVGDGVDRNCDGVDGVDFDLDGWAGEPSGGQDCNDDDPNVNPDALEIPYDQIDNNCDGEDANGITTCDSVPTPTGNDIGDVTEDFLLRDSQNNPIILSDYCGMAVVLASVARWEPNSHDLAPVLQDFYEEYREQGLMVITMVGEGVMFGGDSATPDDLDWWTSEYDITHPVVGDPDWEISDRWEEDFYLPSFILIAPGMRLVARDLLTVTEDDILSILP